jgi:hypothetical protein
MVNLTDNKKSTPPAARKNKIGLIRFKHGCWKCKNKRIEKGRQAV